MIQFDLYSPTMEELSSRVSGLVKDHPELKDILSLMGYIDLTTLEGTDHPGRIEAFCHHALELGSLSPWMPPPAAVCVYPVFVRTACKVLKDSPVKVASVAGAFPSGQSPLPVRLDEIRFALNEGAQEIDTVIPPGKIISGRFDEIAEELHTMHELCREVPLKVILETGELRHPDLIRKACEIALNSGAGFLKTSTGKTGTGATPEAFLIMLDTVAEYHRKTGKRAGIKASGGIATPEQAGIYEGLVRSVAGESWLTPQHFRIGASRLADRIAELAVTE
ncbi:MAG: deoxyribose-phosphate aldolase [Bacteroidales bacterium]|nr:deoxyribose-phosphate aldolase [Bacteroidales bacterium]